MKFHFFLLALFFTVGCNHEQTVQPTIKPTSINFTSFEMSYKGGWYGGFSFYVDSNKIFFAPPISARDISDKTKFGIVSDSVLKVINQVVNALTSDTSIKTEEYNCFDCSAIAINTVVSKDTIKLFQKGRISPPIIKLIRVLDYFIDSIGHNTINSLMILQTSEKVGTPPPSIEAIKGPSRN